MTILSKRPNLDDITSDDERPALKKVKGKLAPKTNKKGKGKAKADDNKGLIKKKG
jgi:hypothetical protein